MSYRLSFCSDVKSIQRLDKGVQFLLSPHVGDFAALLVPPDLHKKTLKQLKSRGLRYNVTQEDIQQDMNHEHAIDLESKKTHQVWSILQLFFFFSTRLIGYDHYPPIILYRIVKGFLRD